MPGGRRKSLRSRKANLRWAKERGEGAATSHKLKRDQLRKKKQQRLRREEEESKKWLEHKEFKRAKAHFEKVAKAHFDRREKEGAGKEKEKEKRKEKKEKKQEEKETENEKKQEEKEKEKEKEKKERERQKESEKKEKKKSKDELTSAEDKATAKLEKKKSKPKLLKEEDEEEQEEIDLKPEKKSKKRREEREADEATAAAAEDEEKQEEPPAKKRRKHQEQTEQHIEDDEEGEDEKGNAIQKKKKKDEPPQQQPTSDSTTTKNKPPKSKKAKDGDDDEDDDDDDDDALFFTDVAGDETVGQEMDTNVGVRSTSPDRLARKRPHRDILHSSLSAETLPEETGMQQDFVGSGAAASSSSTKQEERQGAETGSYKNLKEYLDKARPAELAKLRRERAEGQRYYLNSGEQTSQSLAATARTDDGYLTRSGAKQCCVVCCKTGHKPWECPASRCFFCYGLGHESRNCPQTLKKCDTCGRRGHNKENCLWNQMVDAARSGSWSEVRCANCGEVGHPMCVPEDTQQARDVENAESVEKSKKQSDKAARKAATAVKEILGDKKGKDYWDEDVDKETQQARDVENAESVEKSTKQIDKAARKAAAAAKEILGDKKGKDYWDEDVDKEYRQWRSDQGKPWKNDKNSAAKGRADKDSWSSGGYQKGQWWPKKRQR